MSASTERIATANDRLKARSRRIRWVAIALAAVVHIAILFLMPAFHVDFGGANAVGPRLVISLREWSPPTCGSGCGHPYTAFDSSTAIPELTNNGDLNRRVVSVYPRVMWRHREPSEATYVIAISRAGNVRDLRLIEGDDDAGQPAIAALLRDARFSMPNGTSGMVINVRVGIDTP